MIFLRNIIKMIANNEDCFMEYNKSMCNSIRYGKLNNQTIISIVDVFDTKFTILKRDSFTNANNHWQIALVENIRCILLLKVSQLYWCIRGRSWTIFQEKLVPSWYLYFWGDTAAFECVERLDLSRALILNDKE